MTALGTPPVRETRPGDPRPAPASVMLQAASLLLSYPSHRGLDELDLVADALAESPRSAPRRRLERFLEWWRGLEGNERECFYVATFDFGRNVSLYLTEPGPRTSRERGAALLELRTAYRRLGVAVRSDELPDYLPLMLEAAAHTPACLELLIAQRRAIEALGAALAGRENHFALVVEAVLDLLPDTSQSTSAKVRP